MQRSLQWRVRYWRVGEARLERGNILWQLVVACCGKLADLQRIANHETDAIIPQALIDEQEGFPPHALFIVE